MTSRRRLLERASKSRTGMRHSGLPVTFTTFPGKRPLEFNRPEADRMVMTTQLDVRCAAPRERSGRPEILRQREHLLSVHLLSDVMESIPHAAAILNPHRQVIHANSKLSAMLETPLSNVLGLRPGEALSCVRWAEGEGGCGTGRYCTACGAMNAIVAAQVPGQTETRECRILRNAGTGIQSLDLEITARPLEVGGERFSLLVLRDTTSEKRRRVFERLFFHDILNAVGGLQGIMQVWPDLSDEERGEMSVMAGDLSSRLIDEIESQRELMAAEQSDLEVRMQTVEVRPLLDRIHTTYQHHPASLERILKVTEPAGDPVIRSDPALLERVLGNLIKNALEASASEETVTVGFDETEGPAFHVHNPGVIPEAVQLQIFQRSFSTKGVPGRGLGTWGAKLLTENYLMGKLEFVSRPEEGTTFTVRIAGVRRSRV